MSDNKFGENLTWFLKDISCGDVDQFESHLIDIYGETEDGRDCSAEIDLRELCGAAADRIASLEAQLKEREFRVGVSKMTESHQVTYWVYLDRGDRPLDAKPWDDGRITPFKTKIADNAYTDACEWAEFLGADKPSPPVKEQG